MIVSAALSSRSTGEGARGVSGGAGSPPRWRWRRQETQTGSHGAGRETDRIADWRRADRGEARWQACPYSRRRNGLAWWPASPGKRRLGWPGGLQTIWSELGLQSPQFWWGEEEEEGGVGKGMCGLDFGLRTDTCLTFLHSWGFLNRGRSPQASPHLMRPHCVSSASHCLSVGLSPSIREVEEA